MPLKTIAKLRFGRGAEDKCHQVKSFLKKMDTCDGHKPVRHIRGKAAAVISNFELKIRETSLNELAYIYFRYLNWKGYVGEDFT